MSNASSPRGEVNSMIDYSERLNNSNSVCNALQTQVNSLQGDKENLFLNVLTEELKKRVISYNFFAFSVFSFSDVPDFKCL